MNHTAEQRRDWLTKHNAALTRLTVIISGPALGWQSVEILGISLMVTKHCNPLIVLYESSLSVWLLSTFILA